jgi:hypothetical protein
VAFDGNWVIAMKRAELIAILMLSAVLLGCATDPVAVDLTNYVNQGVLQIAELEQKSLERYAAVTGPNYKSDQEVYAALKDWVIPLYTRFYRGLKKIRPETQEVRDLHRVYLLGAGSLLDGFKTLKVAIEQKDKGLITVVNEKLEKGRLENERWKREATVLANKYGLKFTQGKGTGNSMDSVMEILFGSGGRQM